MTATQTLKPEFKPDPNCKRKDIYQEVTDTIVKQLEKGVVPWRKPWKSENDFSFDLPMNYSTQNKYRGINILLLWASAMDQNLKTNEWATFKQWKEKNESIRQDEKGTMIVYYDTFEREEEGEIKKIPFLKHSYVFNRSQLAGFKPDEKPETEPKGIVEKLDIVEQFVANCNAQIDYNKKMASYNRATDKISMPNSKTFIATDQCSATEGYYATLVHELTHWTGHESRLNRNLGKKFGDKQYAVEELVAELGAAFMCTGFGISRPEKEQHASYIGSWLKALKDDKHVIVAAASEASKASEFLHKLQPE